MPSMLTPRKSTLFDDVDAGMAKKRTAEDSKAALKKLAIDDDSSSLTSLSSEHEFEDVPNAKRQKMEEDSDDDMEFEDVLTHSAPGPSGPPPSGDLELTLRKDTRISLTKPHGTKKGPSKIEREIRIQTHKNHVKWLMLHNAIRNSWLCDVELQSILISQLSPTAVEEVERWRRASVLDSDAEETPSAKGKGKKTRARNQKDWTDPAQRLDNGQANKKGVDPIFRLLKLLMSVWKRRFRITVPGLRKLGYMSLETLGELKKSIDNGPYDSEVHGEWIKDVDELRQRAQAMEGSRDLSAQLFTALLRGLGIEARLVANLQPVGFGWSQNEEALEKNPRRIQGHGPIVDDEYSAEDEECSEDAEKTKPSKAKTKAFSKPKKVVKSAKKSAYFRGNGVQDSPIDLSDSDADSVIDITPAKHRPQPPKPYDKDLLFPHYVSTVYV